MIVLLYHVQQVMRKVLENKINLSTLLKSLLDLNHEVPLQHLQHSDLTLDALTRKLVVVSLLELLYGHSLDHYVPVLPVSRLTAFQTIP